MRHLFGQPSPRSMRIATWLTLGVFAMLASPSAILAQGATGAIVGRVTDLRSGQPVDRATIEVEGTRLGATTVADGRFRVANVPAGAHTVVLRRIGYGIIRTPVTVSAGSDATVDFALDAAAISLDEVVVTGTAGGELRRSISNTVSTIDATTELAKSSATSITSLLNARATGLSIQNTTGRLGATPSIQIRGRSSLSLPNNPLVYIDGVRVSSASGIGPTGTGGFGSQGNNVAGRLNDINPDDIESIEVISGPAAATIYGTEAASGVIQIITKRGGSGGKQAMTGQVQVGSLSFRDAENRIETNYDKDKSGNLILWNGVKQEADSGRPLFKTGMTRIYNTSVAGGQNVTRYYIAGAYENDYGIEPNNSSRMFSLHANASTPLGSRSDLSSSLNFVDRSDHLGADVGASAMFGAEVGHILLNPAARGFYPNFPPEVPQQLYDNSDGTNRFTGSSTLTNRPTDWFTQRAILGVDYIGGDQRAIERYAPPLLAALLPATSSAGRIGQTLRHNTLITADYNGTAKVNLTSALSSSLSVGGQFYNSESNQSFLGGTAFAAPGLETVSATTGAVASTQSQTINTTIGGYAQEQIGWHDRLFLTAAFRVDNNSAFGNDFKWVTYPKLGASWVVNEEPFWRWTHAIPTLRLRAAYGESGRQPQAFAALRTFTPVTGANGAAGVTPGTIGNPDLKPERGKELEVGLEAGFYDRLTVNLTHFSRRTFDEIVNQNLAPSSGFPGARSANLGRVDNSGLELQATLQAITRRHFAWEITGNIGTNKDVIKSLGGVPSLITAAGPANVVGYPIGGYWSRRAVSATRDANGFATGVLCDGTGATGVAAGTGVACATAPFQFLGTQTPGTTGSIGNTIGIGPFRFFGLVDFKRGYVEQGTVELERCTGILGAGLCRANYFPKEFPLLYMAEANTTAYSQNYLDQYYESGNFVKLRELSVTYTLPAALTRGVSRASFGLAAREIHTWTKFRGLDPEAFVGTSEQAVTPPLARLIATLNLQW